MTFAPTYSLTPRMQRQLLATDMTRGFLDAVRLREEWVGSMRHRVRVEDALASVQIEGSSLTLEAAFALAEAGAPQRTLRDSEREFLNYLRAFDQLDDLRNARDYPVRVGDMRNLHRSLVEGVRGGDRFAGELRREGVKVGDIIDGETVVHHQPPPWGDLADHLSDLFTWIADVKRKGSGDDDPWIHPVLVAGIAQQRMVWIHPFVDGNGRTARMLTTLLLFQRGYDFKYLFNLSEYYNANRDRYYEALRTADRTGDYTEWLEYFCGGLSLQMYKIRQLAAGAADGVDPEGV